MKNTPVINKIDHLIDTYCDGCFIRTHFRKEKGKAEAHQFCIHQCTVGEEIKKLGNRLRSSK